MTYLPDVSLLQQVTTDDVKLFICFSYNIYKQQFTTLKWIVFTVQAGCIPGYVGENCLGKCTYPYYGMDCQNQCDCDENRCDFSTGCTNFTKGFASPCTLMVINNNLYFQMIRTFLIYRSINIWWWFFAYRDVFYKYDIATISWIQ